jgi:hypothetical protein
MQNRRARGDYAEKRKGELCHWNIHPESNHLKIIEIAEKKLSGLLRNLCGSGFNLTFQQVLVLTDVFLVMTDPHTPPDQF